MATLTIFFLMLCSPLVISVTGDSINLLVRSSTDPTVRRYCVELAKLPNGRTVNITGFGWHIPYIASAAVNACNATDLENSLPSTFPTNTLLVLYEHQCKMTEHAWNVEKRFGNNISLMILTNRTDTHYELSYNTTTMPVSIPVLILWQNDFNKMNKTYTNLTNTQISIDYPLAMPKKFRPAVLLMFILVLFILLCGNHWAADEFVRKVKYRDVNTHSEPTSVNTSPIVNDFQDSVSNINHHEITIPKTHRGTLADNKTPRNNEPAIVYMPYCIIAFILLFAVGWLY